MFISYKIYVAIYSACIFVFMFIVLRYLDASTVRHQNNKKRRVDMKWLLLFLFLTISPAIVRVILAHGSFLEVDMPVYMRDSALIIENNHIPSPSQLGENPYYTTFPIFTLAISLTKIVTGLDFYTTFIVMQILALVVLSATLWILLCNLFAFKMGFIDNILLSAVVISNSYFYASYNVFIPVVVGFTFLLLLLRSAFTSSGSRGSLGVFLLFAVGALVHIDILVYSFTVLIYLLTANWFVDTGQAQQKRSIAGKILMPLLIFLAYVASSAYSFGSIVGKFLSVFRFLFTFTQNPGLPTGGIPHPVPMLNAMGPALAIGIPSAYVAYTFIYSKVLHRKTATSNSYAFAISLTSVLLLSLASGWYFYGGAWGAGNIMMYFTIYGFALTSISTAFIVITTVHILSSSMNGVRTKILLLLLISLLALATIGSVLDPLTFAIPGAWVE